MSGPKKKLIGKVKVLSIELEVGAITSAQFQRALFDYLRDHSIYDLSVLVDVSCPCVELWIVGRSLPGPLMRPGILALVSSVKEDI